MTLESKNQSISTLEGIKKILRLMFVPLWVKKNQKTEKTN
jgi:hypothetical protein